MKAPLAPDDENQRLEALRRLEVLDTEPEQRYDRLTRIARHHFQVPIALVSLVDAERQWFKSRQGLDACETPRSISFCGHAILSEEIFMIPDALEDSRFADNPLVTGEPHIRFYAGAPLHSPEGQRIGTLCIIDDRPRQFSVQELSVLRDLADAVEEEINRTELLHLAQESSRNARLLDAAVENLPVALFVKRAGDLKMELINKAAEEIFGIRRDALIGRNDWGNFPKEEADSFAFHDRRVLYETGIEDIPEEIITTGDGRRLILHTTKVAIRDEQGNPQFLLGISQDITERKKSEASNQRLSHVLERSLNEIYTFDTETLKFEYVNEGARRNLGYTMEELLHMRAFDIKPGFDEAKFRAMLAPLLNAEKDRLVFEAVHRRADGSDYPVEVHLQLVEENERPVFLAMIMDISQRRSLEKILQQERNISNSILQLAGPIILVIDEHGSIVRFNRAAEEFTGCSFDEVIGKPYIWKNFLLPEERANVEKVFSAAVSGNVPGYHENFWVNRHGEKRLIGWANSVLREESNGTRLLITVGIDISERRLAEARLRESEEKLRGLYELSPLGIALTDMNGRYIEFNRAFEEICGYPLEELNRLDYWQLTPEKYADDEARQLEMLRTRGFYGPYEKEYMRRDGSLVPIRLNGLLLEGRDGNQYIWSIVEDITEQKQNRDALNQFALENEDLYDHAPCGYHSIDENGRIAKVNQTELDWLGYSREEMIGKPVQNFFMLSDEAVSAGLKQLRRDGKLQGVEREALRKDGTTFPVQLNSTAIYDSGGKFLMSRSVLTDISVQKKMERMIRDKMLELQTILNGTSVAIAFVRGRRLIWNNRRMGELFGYSEEEMAGQSTSIFYKSVEDFHSLGIHAYAAMMRGEVFQKELEMRHRDGNAIWINISGKAISPQDLSLGSIWVLEDISARKEYENALRENAEYVHTILSNVVDGIITIDEHGIISSWNPSAERIFGYAHEEAIGRNVSMLMPEPYHGSHDSYLRNFLETGVARVIGTGREVEGLRRNGETFPMDLAVSEIAYKGKRMFVGLVRDITERKRVEKMKNEFVSTVSHELRTPLTSISGTLGLLAGGVLGELPDAVRDLVDIANRNSLRLTHLINDLLDIEKIASGNLKLNMRDLELMTLVEQALEENKSYADQYRVSYVLAERADGVRVRADADRLMQVLANFLSNAAKFSPAGDQVEVRVARENGRVRVTVRDHGPGIPEEFRSRIFQKFSQADSSDTRTKGGTGLGLAISRELAERMGGEVGFESEPGQGAAFHVEFPEKRETASS